MSRPFVVEGGSLRERRGRDALTSFVCMSVYFFKFVRCRGYKFRHPRCSTALLCNALLGGVVVLFFLFVCHSFISRSDLRPLLSLLRKWRRRPLPTPTSPLGCVCGWALVAVVLNLPSSVCLSYLRLPCCQQCLGSSCCLSVIRWLFLVLVVVVCCGVVCVFGFVCLSR